MVSRIIYILGNLLVVFSLHIFCSKMFSQKKAVWPRIVAVITYLMTDSIIYCYANDQRIFVLTSIILYWGFSVAYSIRVNYKNFLLAASFLTFGICSELIASFMVSIFSKIIGKYDVYNEITVTIILSRVLFFAFLVIAARIMKFRNKEEVMSKYIWYILVMPIISIVLVLYIFSLAEFDRNSIHDSGSIGAIVSVSSIVGINILTFYIFDRLNKLYTIETEKALLNQTIMAQQIYYDGERKNRDNFDKVKHEYKNLLISIKTYADMGNIDEIRNIIDKELEMISFNNIPKSNYLAIDSMVVYKAGMAAEKNIKIVPEYKLEGIPKIDNKDVCIIIGNALDNAIEYLEKHKECKQEISFRVVYTKGIFDIKIKNEVSEEIVICDNMVKSTKNEKGHGYGLKAIDCIARKYYGMMILSCDNHQFEMGVIMNL